MTNSKRFQEIMKRAHLPENKEKYHDINMKLTENLPDAELEIWRICETFWPGMPELDKAQADRKLDYLEKLLHDLEWYGF